MKAIELTEEQQDKLLEMCKALFPEYKSIKIGYSQHFNELGYGLPECSHLQFHKAGTQFITIHWFEFCMTYLVERLLNSNPTKPARGLQEKFKSFYWKTNLFWYQLQEGYKGDFSEKHPVDYLYEEFKKLPTKDDRIEKIVFQLIEEVIGKSRKKERTLSSKLSELGLDDLDQLELIMDLEKTLGIFIPDDDVETKIYKPGNTIQHLVDYVRSKI